MKATLKFDLTDFEQRIEHLRCVKATNMYLVLWKFMANSKRRLEDREYSGDTSIYDGIDACFEEIQKLLKEQNINLDELE